MQLDLQNCIAFNSWKLLSPTMVSTKQFEGLFFSGLGFFVVGGGGGGVTAFVKILAIVYFV